MSLLKQIEDKGAVVEWSPITSHSNMVALGTKDSGSAGFDDYGGELELLMLDFSSPSTSSHVVMGKAKANSRFASISWSEMAQHSVTYPYGLVAGGMTDGFIHVWDPAKLASDDPEPCLASIEQHQGAIHGLRFNPHKESSHLLASGGNDAEVFVMSLERPDAPNVFIPAPPPNNAKHTAGITKVAWNTQVPHILASASQNGSTYVWDLKQKKAWCEIRDPAGGVVSDIAWNPDQGPHIITASGDDRNPVIKLWDLRSSTSLPLATLAGHTEGILSVSWCPNDPSLLLSCGKDNKTMLWDLFHLQAVYDLSSAGGDSPAQQQEQNVFGSFASSAGLRKRYHVQWSPCIPAVISACSFDRSVQFYSLSGVRSRIGRAPKWLRKPIGATFGFGGKLVQFDSQNLVPATDKKAGNGSAKIKISQVVEDVELVTACDGFHSSLAASDLKSFCEMKASTALSSHDAQVWALMKVICFEQNSREELLAHLGFDMQSISAAADMYIGSKDGLGKVQGGLMDGNGDNSDDLFAGSAPSAMPPLAKLPPDAAAATAEMVAAVVAGKEAEPIIRSAIVVGNFAAAVDCCIQAGLMAEALLLSQCGDPSLWQKTQEAFFAKQKNKFPFLSVLHSVIKAELMDYVLSSDLQKWRETLAILSTFGRREQFPAMCEALAVRLEAELGDYNSANLCYMCSSNMIRTIAFWTSELLAANDRLGYVDTQALQQYVEKVVVFNTANPGDLGQDCSRYFAMYGGLLASQGRLDVAARYIKGLSLEESILMDRLYQAGNKPAGSRPPAFPFERVNVSAVVAKAEVKAQPAAQQSQPVQQPVQQQQQQQQQQQRAAHPAIAAQSSQPQQQPLPAGWVQLADPSSGRTYYANQSTGQTQWEHPAPAVAQQPVQQPVQQQYAQQQVQQPYAQQQPVQQPYAQQQPVQQPYSQQQPSYQPQQMGFGSVGGAASMPAGSPNPNLNPISQPVQQQQPVSAAPSSSAATSAAPVDSQPVTALGVIVDSIAATLAPAEKRQFAVVTTGYQNLCGKAAANEVAADVMQKIALLVSHISARNYSAASAVQTDLANTAWNNHKEWIKAVKILIPLLSKK